MEFLDQWLWLITMAAGLLLAIMELLVGVDTGLDLVFVGSGFILSGLVTWPFHSWVVTAIVAVVVCTVYIAIGRKYIHRWTAAKSEKTNVDAMIGKRGIVLKDISSNVTSLVRVGGEEWRALADEEVERGCDVEVVEVKGVTLTVKKAKGGN